jgi:hypothetical protein
MDDYLDYDEEISRYLRDALNEYAGHNDAALLMDDGTGYFVDPDSTAFVDGSKVG